MGLEYLGVQFLETKLADVPGAFSGYGAIFGNFDANDDVIRSGAFTRTLKEWEADRGKLPPMLLQHGGGFFGGSAEDMLPVGQWTSMEENKKGLKVEGQLFALNTEKGQYIYEGLQSGVLDGLSIGFETKEFISGTKPGEPNRTLTDIELWEVSIVTFPANLDARVGAVKNLSIDELRELEGVLRDGGLSRRDGLKAISAFKRWFQRDAEAPDSEPCDEVSSDLIDAANELAAKFVKDSLHRK